jgi:hypothetical protein
VTYKTDGSAFLPYFTVVKSQKEGIRSSIHYEHMASDNGRIEILHWTGGPTLGFGPTRYTGKAQRGPNAYVEALVFSSNASCKVDFIY